MSVLAESMEPTKPFDNPFDLPDVDDDALMDLGAPDLVDPQLTMLYPGQARDKLADPFAMNTPFTWDAPVEATMSLFDSAIHSQDDAANFDAMAESFDIPTSPSSAANLSSRRTSKASRASSKSSAPSLTSTSQPTKKRARKPTRKKQEQQKQQALAAAAAVAVATTTTMATTAALAQIKDEGHSGGEGDVKRNKYLERNRVAASKCRQKKKEWVLELEESKAELEAKHADLQREYTALLGEVSMVKNLLMRHAACKDPTIDQWIGIEAKRFVQKSSNAEETAAQAAAATAAVAAARHSSVSTKSQSVSHTASESTSRRESFVAEGSPELASGPTTKSVSESLNPLSPAPSSVQFRLSPIIKMEDLEINYDHMPDDMFV